MKYIKAICAAILLSSMASMNGISASNLALEGFKKGIQAAVPDNPFNWLALLAWWQAPSAAFCLYGLKNFADQGIYPEQYNASSPVAHDNDILKNTYVAGYTLGNALHILAYTAPTFLINWWRVHAHVLTPHEIPEYHGKIANQIYTTSLWGFSAMTLPLILQLLTSVTNTPQG